jgi:hypothetical protein
MIRLETSNFKASLLGLLGESLEQARATCPGFRIVNENGKAGRMLWEDEVTDTDMGTRFKIIYMARFLKGRIWAVGIWAEDHVFSLSREGDRIWFSSVPRPPKEDRGSVNWIVLKEGKPFEEGVSA